MADENELHSLVSGAEEVHSFSEGSPAWFSKDEYFGSNSDAIC